MRWLGLQSISVYTEVWKVHFIHWYGAGPAVTVPDRARRTRRRPIQPRERKKDETNVNHMRQTIQPLSIEVDSYCMYFYIWYYIVYLCTIECLVKLIYKLLQKIMYLIVISKIWLSLFCSREAYKNKKQYRWGGHQQYKKKWTDVGTEQKSCVCAFEAKIRARECVYTGLLH